MARKALIPEEKWEGLRRAMQEAAGARKTTGSPGDSGGAISGGTTARTKGEENEGKKGEKADKKRRKKGKKAGKKEKKKGKKGKGKKKGKQEKKKGKKR
jgi:hypothetical protein